MKISIRQLTTKFRLVGLSACVVSLVVVVAVSYLLLAPFVYRLNGSGGLWAAGLAACVCLAGAVSAVVTPQFFCGQKHEFAGMLLGMLFRMAIPLVVCMVVYLQGGVLSESGFVYYILAFYFITLVVDTWMATGRTSGAQRTSEDG